MASKISINLDTSKENFLVNKCKQNDDLVLEAFIYENGAELDLTNKEIIIQALKSDNTYIIQNTEIVKENNKILAELDRDFSRVSGTTKIEILLVESGKQNTTFSFYLEVSASVINGAVESSNTVTILEALDNKIIETGQVLDEAIQVKEDTEQLIESGGAATTGDIANITAQLDNIMIYKNFQGLKGDGVTDDSKALQDIFDLVSQTKIRKIILPKANYYITKPLYIKCDDLEVDFSGSKIIWNGVSGEANQRLLRAIGVLNVHGDYERDRGNAIYVNVEEFHPKQPYLTADWVAKIKTTNNSYFKEGDFVRLDIYTGHNLTRSVDNEYPEADVMCKIVRIDANYIYVDYYSPFDFSKPYGNTLYHSGTWKYVDGYNMSDGNYPPPLNATLGRVYKVKPISGVQVRNLVIDDRQVIEEDINKLVAGVSFLFAKDYLAENIEGYNNKYPLVINRWGYKGRCKNIHLNRPAKQDAGCGYAIQWVWCMFTESNLITSHNARHTIDISGGYKHRITECDDSDTFTGFTLHGMCEHDVVFEQCKTSCITTGHGLEFSDMISNVRYINCVFSFYGDNNAMSYNMYYENCDILMTTFYNFDATFNKCRIKFIDGLVNEKYPCRGRNKTKKKSSLKFYDCKITTDGTQISIKWYDELLFDENCEFIQDDDSQNFLSRSISLKSISNIVFNCVNLDNIIRIYLDGTEFNNSLKNPNEAFINFTFSNNKLSKRIIANESGVQLNKGLVRYIYPTNINNCKLLMNISGNKVIHNKGAGVPANEDSGALIMIVNGTGGGISADYTGAEINLICTDNNIFSNNTDGIGIVCDATPTGYTLNKVIKNNILKNAPSFDVCDTTNNIKY